jgi:lambda family phage minor tail protein L
MPYPITDGFRTEKNKQENRPVMLYEISIPSPTSTLRLCEWDTTIHYPTGITGFDYLPFPLKHEGIGSNALGEIDSVKVTLSSVDRTIVSALSTNNGLIGSKVVMKLIFLDKLDDATANISSTFYVDSVAITEQAATFNLTSKLDLYEVVLPGRKFERDYCRWFFKEEGCWLWDVNHWDPPGGFLHGDVECDHTRNGPEGCKYHVNSSRFGGFPAIPKRGIWVA